MDAIDDFLVSNLKAEKSDFIQKKRRKKNIKWSDFDVLYVEIYLKIIDTSFKISEKKIKTEGT